MEGDLTKKWHWEEAYQTVELDGGGSNLEVALGEAYQRVELDGGGFNRGGTGRRLTRQWN